MDESDDQRDVELSSLTAIFPEIRRVSEDDPYTITLDVPVNPSKAITVLFPAAADGAPPLDHAPAVNNRTLAGSGAQVNNGNIESHELSHLPPVTLRICLPKNYPLDEPPAVTVTTSPPWLPQDTARKLEADCARLWEELGRDLVVFTFIDHIQQCTDDVFALINDDGVLEIDPQHKIAVLDYDIKAKRAAFENGTFDCGVCLEPKKGKVCHRMMDCGHVFCVQCLQDFYNNAITEGDLASVRCLEPSCAKERGAAQTSTGKKRRKPKTFISPSELLQIPLETDVVKRYVTLKYKTELESDKNTIYCPRTWCQGAARSRKHKKPEGLEFEEGLSDSESEPDDEAEGAGGANGAASSKPPKKYQAKDLLAICEDCGFAFCSRCFQSWHGEFFRCMPRRDKEELSAEEKASLEYVQLHTTPCPTCDCPAQKTHGCNHMICFRCNTHFCYLCSAWLDPGNPYQHFNEMPDGSRTGCYMRLWELEHGDGADVGYGYLGGGGPGQNNNAPAPAAAALEPAQPWHAVPEIEEPDDEEDEEIVGEHDRGEHGRGGNGGQVGVAREGPLVLRIAGDPQPARPARPAPPAVPNPPAAGGRNQAGNNRGRHPQQQQQAHRGRGGGGGRGRQRGRAGDVRIEEERLVHQDLFQRLLREGMVVGDHIPHNENPGPPEPRPHARPRVVDRAGARRQHEPAPQGQLELDEAQQAWVRNFVRLAMEDDEDLLGSDSDEEIEEIVFRVV